MQEVFKKFSTLGMLGVIYHDHNGCYRLEWRCHHNSFSTISGSAGMIGGIAVIGITGLIAVA
jgi:hypothetical protein